MSEIIDEKDKKIIELLEKNAKQSTRSIAKKTLLPITTIHNRLKKLREQKIIKKYTIELDHEKLNQNFLAYILITVDIQRLKDLNKTQYDVALELKKFHFVERVDIVSGGTDIITFIRVRDVREFDSVLLGKIQSIKGVEKTQSMIVIHQ